MSEETPVVETDTVDQEIIDLEQSQTNGQIDTKAFWYKLVSTSGDSHLTVLAASSTAAREGIKQRFPFATAHFLGTSETIMQVNG